MDIWAWVMDEVDRVMEEDKRLAWSLYKLPSWVSDNEYERVDASIPELLAGVRRLKRPWLEVYVRHWQLQSLVLDRHDVSDGMGLAVELLDRAHQPDTKSCPQAVCVAQDVCAAYGIADGPGFAEERLAVSQETLDRIDPSWPCWSCINREHISALLDQGRDEDALERCESALAEMRAADPEVNEGEFALQEVDALMNLGRFEEAHATLEAAEQPGRGKRFLRHKRVILARTLTALGRAEEAAAQLPGWEELRMSSFVYGDYARAVDALVRAGALTYGAQEHKRMAFMVRHQLELGAVGGAHALAQRTAELCLHQGEGRLGLAVLDLAEPALKRLRKPLGAQGRVAELRAALREAAERELPEDIDAARARFNDPSGTSYDLVFGLADRFPDEPKFSTVAAGCWKLFGHPDLALALIERALTHAPSDPGLVCAKGSALLEARELDAVDALLEAHEATEDEAFGVELARLRAQLAEARQDPATAIEALQRALQTEAGQVDGRPDPATLESLARLQREAGQLAEALASTTQLLDAWPDRAELRWTLLALGTQLERWPFVREQARLLGLTVGEGEGPIDADWGLCKILFEEEGPEVTRWARRTGPATATVLSISGPDAVEHYGEALIFAPRAVDEEDPVFPFVACVKPGGYVSFALDGVHPGDEAVSRISATVASLKGALRVVSGEKYRLTDPDSGEEHRGFYAYVAWPEGNPPMILNMLLNQATRGLEHPIIWTGVAEAMGDAALAAEHAAIAKSWEM